MTGPTRMQELASKVAFLGRPDAYPEPPPRVEVVETHMSYVFLTTTRAYKLKKPVRHEDLDFTTLEHRRRYCEEEVRLNRRLASRVYLGTIRLTRGADGVLSLDGQGEVVDWLVHMRRLPAEHMLDAMIARLTVERDDVEDMARKLADFFWHATGLPIPGHVVRRRLEQGTHSDRRALLRAPLGLDHERIEAVARRQLSFLREHAAEFDSRAQAGRIVDGHGDLRPEHICLAPPPVVIDCLEFCEELRQLDPIDELAFLELECHRLGQPAIGQWFLETYTLTTGDRPSPGLLDFYRNYRAMRRATLAVWRLADPIPGDSRHVADKARGYLALTNQ